MKKLLLLGLLFSISFSYGQIKWPKVTIKKPKITVGKPKITVGTPKVTIKKPKITVATPKVTIANPKITIAKPEIKADVIGDIKNPTKIIRNAVRISVEPLPGGDLVVEVIEDTTVKPTDEIIKGTEIFIKNAGEELERGWENGTIQTIAIAVASYYIGGPAVFELVGWQRYAGAVLIDLAISNLINVDSKTADITEKIIIDAVKESEKTLGSIIDDLKNAICSLSGVPESNCNFNLILKTELSEEQFRVGVAENLKSHYNYYKKTYENVVDFHTNLKKNRRKHLKNYNLAVTKATVDPILAKMLQGSKQFFTTMSFTSEILINGNFSDIEMANVLQMFNEASSNYYATNYVFSNKDLEISKVGDINIKKILTQWSFEKDGIEYFHHDLIDNYITVQNTKDIARAPAMSKLVPVLIAGVYFGTKWYGNFYHGMNTIDNIQHYRDIINNGDIRTRAKYNYMDKVLHRMQLSTLSILGQEMVKEIPNLFFLYSRVAEGKKILKPKDFFDLIDTVGGKKYDEEIKKLEKLIKEEKLPKNK